MPKPTLTCKNCNQFFEAQYPYCPYCGQQAEDKLTIGVLFANTISNYFTFDARFFKSFIPLMIKPGYLPKKFVQGKRLLFIHPAQLYLFISVVFFFLFSFISREQAQSIDSALKTDIENSKAIKDSVHQRIEDSLAMERFMKPLRNNQKKYGINDEDLRVLDSVVDSGNSNNINIFNVHFKEVEIDSMVEAGASDQAIYKKMGMKSSDGFWKKRIYRQVLKFIKSKSGGSVLQAFYDSIPIAMFILLPIFALLLKLFYMDKGRFAHHLVFSFYFFSFLFTVFAVLVGASLMWENLSWWYIILIMLSTYFYFFLAVRHFYEQGYILSFIKSSVITFLFLSLVIPFSTTIMVFIAFLFY
ncbi:MAG: DUF3667 domain-containing protein [Aquaticitalea sp.]